MPGKDPTKRSQKKSNSRTFQLVSRPILDLPGENDQNSTNADTQKTLLQPILSANERKKIARKAGYYNKEKELEKAEMDMYRPIGNLNVAETFGEETCEMLGLIEEDEEFDSDEEGSEDNMVVVGTGGNNSNIYPSASSGANVNNSSKSNRSVKFKLVNKPTSTKSIPSGSNSSKNNNSKKKRVLNAADGTYIVGQNYEDSEEEEALDKACQGGDFDWGEDDGDWGEEDWNYDDEDAESLRSDDESYFPNDGYDYSRHMRCISNENAMLVNSSETQAGASSIRTKNLLEKKTGKKNLHVMQGMHADVDKLIATSATSRSGNQDVKNLGENYKQKAFKEGGAILIDTIKEEQEAKTKEMAVFVDPLDSRVQVTQQQHQTSDHTTNLQDNTNSQDLLDVFAALEAADDDENGGYQEFIVTTQEEEKENGTKNEVTDDAWDNFVALAGGMKQDDFLQEMWGAEGAEQCKLERMVDGMKRKMGGSGGLGVKVDWDAAQYEDDEEDEDEEDSESEEENSEEEDQEDDQQHLYDELDEVEEQRKQQGMKKNMNEFRLEKVLMNEYDDEDIGELEPHMAGPTANANSTTGTRKNEGELDLEQDLAHVLDDFLMEQKKTKKMWTDELLTLKPSEDGSDLVSDQKKNMLRVTDEFSDIEKNLVFKQNKRDCTENLLEVESERILDSAAGEIGHDPNFRPFYGKKKKGSAIEKVHLTREFSDGTKKTRLGRGLLDYVEDLEESGDSIDPFKNNNTDIKFSLPGHGDYIQSASSSTTAASSPSKESTSESPSKEDDSDDDFHATQEKDRLLLSSDSEDEEEKLCTNNVNSGNLNDINMIKKKSNKSNKGLSTAKPSGVAYVTTVTENTPDSLGQTRLPHAKPTKQEILKFADRMLEEEISHEEKTKLREKRFGPEAAQKMNDRRLLKLMGIERKDKAAEWDVETVLSTKSNLSNHPGKMLELGKLKKPRAYLKELQKEMEERMAMNGIVSGSKNGVDLVSSKKGGEADENKSSESNNGGGGLIDWGNVNSLGRIDEEDSDEEVELDSDSDDGVVHINGCQESGNLDQCSDSDDEGVYILPTDQITGPRDKSETKEEKKARKQAVKQARKMCREMKKENKKAFANEGRKAARLKSSGTTGDIKSGSRIFQL